MGPNKKPVVLTLQQPCSGWYVFNAILPPLPDKDSSALYRKTMTFISQNPFPGIDFANEKKLCDIQKIKKMILEDGMILDHQKMEKNKNRISQEAVATRCGQNAIPDSLTMSSWKPLGLAD